VAYTFVFIETAYAPRAREYDRANPGKGKILSRHADYMKLRIDTREQVEKELRKETNPFHQII
jgi:hypothetical protein